MQSAEALGGTCPHARPFWCDMHASIYGCHTPCATGTAAGFHVLGHLAVWCGKGSWLLCVSGCAGAASRWCCRRNPWAATWSSCHVIRSSRQHRSGDWEFLGIGKIKPGVGSRSSVPAVCLCVSCRGALYVLTVLRPVGVHVLCLGGGGVQQSV